MKISEFKRWLEARGAKFEEGANHWIAVLDGKKAPVPRHPSKELKTGTRKNILKQLGIK